MSLSCKDIIQEPSRAHEPLWSGKTSINSRLCGKFLKHREKYEQLGVMEIVREARGFISGEGTV